MYHALTATKSRWTAKQVRWSIAAVLFLSTVINYIDRQSVAVLGPFLQRDFRWTHQDFAYLIVSFRIAYAVGQTFCGRLVDKLGTRRALSLSVAWYSLSALLSPLARGLGSLCVFRFLLGTGESANWPAATKAVSEWFPKQERGWAVALFDSGSSVGAAIAPFFVLGLYKAFGSWRPALAIPGLLGFAWLIAWRAIYRKPEEHPWLQPEDRQPIREERATVHSARWSELLRIPATWGIILGRSLTDPVWFFISDWFAIYLASKHFNLEQGILGFWIPFVAADIGNFAGGGVSSLLVRRGWNVIAARKAVIVVCGLGMTLLIPAVFTNQMWVIVALFSVSTCSYAAWSTMALTLPSDIYPSESVASVSGLSGGGAGVATVISTLLIGWVADRYSFGPVLTMASVVPLAATLLVLLLVRMPGNQHT
ncbi:MAG: MFS transporter [Acidobacteriaceae bacterium]|nr:MFS transporter [Acidobacteriaceae bacterium]